VAHLFERIIDTYPMTDPAEFAVSGAGTAGRRGLTCRVQLYRDYGIVLGVMGKEDAAYNAKMLEAWRL